MTKDSKNLTPEEILKGLSPKLEGELANLVGLALEELAAKIERFPWADRATLAAYGLIELRVAPPGSQRGGVKKVLPKCIEVIDGATFRG